MDKNADYNYLPHSDLLELRRWNCPSVYNGWELITKRDLLECSYNKEAIIDFAPQMGPMVGYAVTVEYICSDKKLCEEHGPGIRELQEYLADIPGPKIMMCKDLDAPHSVGSIFGEVSGNSYRALGAVGAITDGWVRDVDEACYGGFKLMAKYLGVGHAYMCHLRFGNEIEIFGSKIKPGMLVHADKYGFIAIPKDEATYLAEAVRFADINECRTVIPAAREVVGKSVSEILENMGIAGMQSRKNIIEFKKKIFSSDK